MLPEKYIQLDQALIKAISMGWTTVAALSHENAGLWPAVQPLRLKDPWHGGLTPVAHVVAKRLQELRKQGLIIYQEKRWTLSSLGEKQLTTAQQCAVNDEPKTQPLMQSRTDAMTAHKVNQAIKMKASRGTLAAARFLDRHAVPLEVAMRALSIAPGDTRPLS